MEVYPPNHCQTDAFRDMEEKMEQEMNNTTSPDYIDRMRNHNEGDPHG